MKMNCWTKDELLDHVLVSARNLLLIGTAERWRALSASRRPVPRATGAAYDSQVLDAIAPLDSVTKTTEQVVKRLMTLDGYSHADAVAISKEVADDLQDHFKWLLENLPGCRYEPILAMPQVVRSGTSSSSAE